MSEHDKQTMAQGGNHRGFLTPFHGKIFEFLSLLPLLLATSHIVTPRLQSQFFPRTFGVTITGVDCIGLSSTYFHLVQFYQMMDTSLSSIIGTQASKYQDYHSMMTPFTTLTIAAAAYANCFLKFSTTTCPSASVLNFPSSKRLFIDNMARIQVGSRQPTAYLYAVQYGF